MFHRSVKLQLARRSPPTPWSDSHHGIHEGLSPTGGFSGLYIPLHAQWAATHLDTRTTVEHLSADGRGASPRALQLQHGSSARAQAIAQGGRGHLSTHTTSRYGLYVVTLPNPR